VGAYPVALSRSPLV